MKKALIFGFVATSLTMMAITQPAKANSDNIRIPASHVCTPEQIDLTVRTIGVIERNCSPESLAVMQELGLQMATCDITQTAPAWWTKIGKASVAAGTYTAKCAVQKAAAENAARQQAQAQQQQQQQLQQQQDQQ